MRDFRSILNILGLLLCIESIAMIILLLFDLLNNNSDWKQFFYSSIFTFFIGLVLFISFKKEQLKIDLRQAFVLTFASWLLCFFAILVIALISESDIIGLVGVSIKIIGFCTF